MNSGFQIKYFDTQTQNKKEMSGVEETKIKSNERTNTHSDEKRQHGAQERETWSGRLDFVLTNVGYAVGFSNIWRFPYLCYKNGGGSFLIPYMIFLATTILPMFILEFGISQFSSCSCVSVWNICPLMKGLGYGMVTVSTIVMVYLNVLMAWVLYYLYKSFTSVLPWSTCNNEWNTRNCYENGLRNTSATNSSFLNETSDKTRTLPAEEFFRNQVLQITTGLEEMGNLRLELLLCLFIFWVIVFLCLCKGIKVSGKIVYVTATAPYVILLIFLIRGATLPGSYDGVKYYIVPKWDKMLTTQVWGEAAVQIFFSSAVGWGGLYTFASYNKFHHNIYRDAMVIPAINGATSIFAGFVTFTMLGFLAKQKGTRIDEVITQGPGVTFITYPEAIANLPVSPVWSVLFFLMLVVIGIDTQFGGTEIIITGLTDQHPKFLRRRKSLLVACICAGGFIFGIPLVMQGGIYVLQIVDWYASMFSIMLICLLECITVGWIYGSRRFFLDLEMMLGFKPCRWWEVFWKFITPFIILLMISFNISQIKPVSYGSYQYPPWALAIGWIIAFSSILPIPIQMISSLLTSEGSIIQRIKNTTEPTSQWGPALKVHRQQYLESLDISGTNTTISSKTPELQHFISNY